jgi:DNA-binding NarL/FixJ family response regulator
MLLDVEDGFVAISAHVDPAFVRAALHAGAAAFVRKEHAGSELPHAIRRALGLDGPPTERSPR